MRGWNKECIAINNNRSSASAIKKKVLQMCTHRHILLRDFDIQVALSPAHTAVEPIGSSQHERQQQQSLLSLAHDSRSREGRINTRKVGRTHVFASSFARPF